VTSDGRAAPQSAESSESQSSPVTRRHPLSINIVTIFPGFFEGPLGLSIPARAAAAGAVRYRVVDLREHTHDRHRTVDDYPYGGGPGMVMKPQPFFEAVEALGARAPIVLLSPRGRVFTHADAARFAAGDEVTFLCGHYKDVDQRVADHLATEELSLGDFVLSGGEPAALAMVDATVRLLPGAMSDLDSARTDSFFERGISAPSYTRPPEYRGHEVPPVLLSGDHKKIALWRLTEGERLTRERPPR
jgi:tRNA (guanine37-N1)-methyltransferase